MAIVGWGWGHPDGMARGEVDISQGSPGALGRVQPCQIAEDELAKMFSGSLYRGHPSRTVDAGVGGRQGVMG